MKSLSKNLLTILLPALSISGISAQDSGRNYVSETVVRITGVTSASQAVSLGPQDACRTVTYHDGLGFPVQSVTVGAVSSGNGDLVQHHEYDQYMREARTWLPYADLSESGAGFRDGAGQATLSFYQSENMTGMKPEAAPYSETVYEQSLLDRVLEQGAPGAAWQPAPARTAESGHTVVTEYGTCPDTGADAVRIWEVSSTGLSASGHYLPGSLERKTLKNEDWVSGRNGTADIYTDLDGIVILERRWILYGGSDIALDTYYVYDDLGRLRYVLPPMLSACVAGKSSVSADDPDMLGYGYAYRYDGNGDCIWKRLPGCSPVVMKYDRWHRLVLSQDGNQAAKGEWTFFFYDNLGRQAVTGSGPIPYSGDISQAEFRARYTGEGSAGGYELSIPLPAASDIQKICYYDGYGFTEEVEDSLFAVPEGAERFGRGQMTGTAVWKLNAGATGGPLYSMFVYDDRGRTVRTVAMNHMNGTETEDVTYSFTDQPVRRVRTHSAGNMPTVVEEYGYTYDNMDRLLTVTHSLGDGEDVTLADNTYDNLGRLIRDCRSGMDSLATDYAYNIRSWQTEIGSDVFAERLSYESPEDSTAAARYAGSVSEMKWSIAGEEEHIYRFFYDDLDRITDADYSVSSGENSYSTAYSYDPHGNILSLSRGVNGVVRTSAMQYDGNRLSSVNSSGSTFTGMTYDSNGNLTHDMSSGIASVTYNSFNLPAMFSVSAAEGNSTTSYVYDADGRKLSATMTGTDGRTETTDWSSNVIYRNGTLDRILIEGGYIKDGKYHFYVTDHLGSVRAVMDEEGKVVHTVHYYPFGEEFGSENEADSIEQPYRFNAKEDQSFTGVPLLDYGARFYNPALARWTTLDPLAEKYYSISPYTFCNNNPVRYVDYTGRAYGNYYSSTGEFIASDGIDDDKIYLVSSESVKNYTEALQNNNAGIAKEEVFKGAEEVGGLIIQNREEESETYTISTFTSIGGTESVSGYILEPAGPSTDKANQNKRVPEGVYNLDNYSSKNYPEHFVLYNDDVSTDRAILYHPGNTAKDTKGCMLPGSTYNGNGVVGQSTKKFNELKNYINNVGVKNVRVIINNKIK